MGDCFPSTDGYQGPWMPKSLLQNGIVFAHNLCTASCVLIIANGMPTHHFIHVESAQYLAHGKFKSCGLEHSGIFFFFFDPKLSESLNVELVDMESRLCICNSICVGGVQCWGSPCSVCSCVLCRFLFPGSSPCNRRVSCAGQSGLFLTQQDSVFDHR